MLFSAASLFIVLLVRAQCKEETSENSQSELVWAVDPVTLERYQVSKLTYELDAEFVSPPVDEAVFSRAYLSELASECTFGSPGLFEFFNKTLIAVREFCFNPNRYPYSLKIYWRVLQAASAKPFLAASGIAFAMGLLRLLLERIIISSSLGKNSPDEKNRRKAISSLWNALSYATLASFDAYVVLVIGAKDFQHPLCMFNYIRFKSLNFDVDIDDGSDQSIAPQRHTVYVGYFDEPLPSSYYWLYIMQMAYYTHAFYATLKLDVPRADTRVLQVHHVVTILLLAFSLFAKLHKMGALVLLLHDVSDILLETGKLMISLRDAFPKHRTSFEFAANLCFGIFTFSWFYLRIYLFPTKVMYSTTWGVYLTHLGREAPFFLLLNSLLWILFMMQLYWSYFILKVLFRIISGTKGIEDSREFDAKETTFKKNKEQMPCTNGFHEEDDLNKRKIN